MHMMHHFWRLSEGGDNNLGLACTDDGLFLGRTPLIERHGRRFTVRDRSEIEHLFRRIDQICGLESGITSAHGRAAESRLVRTDRWFGQ
jgi:hypothetical protein